MGRMPNTTAGPVRTVRLGSDVLLGSPRLRGARVGQWEQHAGRDEPVARRVELESGRSQHEVQVSRPGLEFVELGGLNAGRALECEGLVAQHEPAGVTKRTTDDVGDEREPRTGNELETGRVVQLVRHGFVAAQLGKKAKSLDIVRRLRITDIDMLDESIGSAGRDQEHLHLCAGAQEIPLVPGRQP